MINLAWGNYKNGSVPDSVTASVDSAGHRLEKTAASNWLAMRQACFDATGIWINIAPGAGSAGRTLAQQQEFWRLYVAGGNTAAVPGTSNHGWWRAVDITGYETATSRWVGSTYVNDGPVWKWLMANMARFGFSWDTGRASRESWHFESIAAPGTATAGGNASPIATGDEIDMASLDDLKNVQGASFLPFCVQNTEPGAAPTPGLAIFSNGYVEAINIDQWNAYGMAGAKQYKTTSGGHFAFLTDQAARLRASFNVNQPVQIDAATLDALAKKIAAASPLLTADQVADQVAAELAKRLTA